MSPDEEMNEDELRELIRDALRNSKSFKKKLNKQIDLDNALLSTLSEFLDAFLILGYDMDGNPLIIKNSKTQMQNDALKSLYIKYLPCLHEDM